MGTKPIDRYQYLAVKECLSKPSQYVLACKELSFLLKNGFSKFPKNLQLLIFQDTLFVFILLPEIQTQSAISAANSLLQSAEFALPKQKRALAVKEHKNAVVAIKRKSKTYKEEEEEGLTQLPQDVLLHVFGFLDLQSLLSSSAVCRSWNDAAGDNQLWKLLYETYFCSCNEIMQKTGLEADNNTACGVNYRFACKTAYIDACHRKIRYDRGYCSTCHSIVWLSCNRCSNETNRRDRVKHKIKPVTMERIVEFILDGLSSESSSDSDSDPEDVYALGLWAYPRRIN